MRTEHLEQRIDMLTELVSTLVVAFDQNATNVAPAISLGILLANAEGGEALPPQEGGNATTSEARTNTSARRRHAQRICRNITRVVSEDREPTKNPFRLRALETRFSTGLKGQRPTQTWMTITTSSLNTRLAPREVPTYVLGLMLYAHSPSSKPRRRELALYPSNARGRTLDTNASAD